MLVSRRRVRIEVEQKTVRIVAAATPPDQAVDSVDPSTSTPKTLEAVDSRRLASALALPPEGDRYDR
jgi:hypothetical protein